MNTCDCNIVTKYYLPPKYQMYTAPARPSYAQSVLSSHSLVSRFKQKFIITTSSECLKYNNKKLILNVKVRRCRFVE